MLGVADANALGSLADLGDGRVELDGVAESLGEGVGDAVHAADGLEHGGLHLKLLLEEDAVPEVGVEQGVHVDGLAEDSGFGACAGGFDVAGILTSGVFAGVVERAVGAEETEHAVAIGGGDVLVERAVANALGEQLADVAAGVVDDLALHHGLAAVGCVVLQEGGAAGVDLDLEFDAELAAIAEDGGVDGRQAGGADVLIVAGIEGAGLGGAIEEGDGVAAADGPVAAAGTGAGFEDGAVEAEGAHLIGGDQAGDAAAEDDDFDALAGVGSDREGKLFLRAGGQETQRLHGEEGSAVSASLAYTQEEIATGNRHGDTSSFRVFEPEALLCHGA